MKIESVKIMNFKGLDRIEQQINGGDVYVIGGNGKGKTSFIGAIWTAITGKGIPTEPIKKGTTESVVQVELTDFVAELIFKKGKGGKVMNEFRLVQKSDGTIVDKPRTILNSMIGVIDFDPNHFFELSAAKQIEYFCQVVGLNFDEIDRKAKELFDERTFQNKEAKRLRDTTDLWFDETKANAETVDVAALYEKRIADDKKRENISKVMTGIDDRSKQIYANRREIERLMNESASLNADIERANDWLDQADNQPMTEPERERLLDQIETADAVNADIAANRNAKANAEKLRVVETNIIEIENEMTELKESKRQKLIAAIDIPDLTFDGDQFLFSGLPFENTQINTANQLIAGLRIGMKALKDVRILKFDGSLIDENNMKLINDWADENDVQLFVELVDRTGGDLCIHVTENESLPEEAGQ